MLTIEKSLMNITWKVDVAFWNCVVVDDFRVQIVWEKVGVFDLPAGRILIRYQRFSLTLRA